MGFIQSHLGVVLDTLGCYFMKEKKNRVWPVAVSSLVVVAASLSFFFSAMHKKSQICIGLEDKIKELETLKSSFLEEKEDLLLQLSSRDDKDWIEMVLKKRLGVVPEGQMKVYFRKNEP